jgi:thiosulfate reductase cytochrome b subunit
MPSNCQQLLQHVHSHTTCTIAVAVAAVVFCTYATRCSSGHDRHQLVMHHPALKHNQHLAIYGTTQHTKRGAYNPLQRCTPTQVMYKYLI